ncbi:MAG TPA: PA2779 family protein [Burkholderiales bacterium]|nr:PA2779 family protein [Burkholderiales bacterium]
MTQRLRNRLSQIAMLFALALATAFVMPRAHAEMIATDESPQVQPQSERERVKALIARPEVAKKLGDLGVASGDASARVDAMTDAEVVQLAGKIDSLIAGGALSNDQLLIIILLVVLLVLVL